MMSWVILILTSLLLGTALGCLLLLVDVWCERWFARGSIRHSLVQGLSVGVTSWPAFAVAARAAKSVDEIGAAIALATGGTLIGGWLLSRKVALRDPIRGGKP